MKKNMMSERRAIRMFSILASYSQQQTPQLSGGLVVFYLIVCVFVIACMWKIFTKAGEPGWACIIPFYSSYVIFKINYGNGLKFLLMFIPVLNVIASIMMYVRLGQRFGKGTGFILGMLFLPVIFLPMLAFGDSYYQGPDTQAFL